MVRLNWAVGSRSQNTCTNFGPRRHYQLTSLFFRGFFCILLCPHFAVSRPLRRLQLASTFGVWRSLLISLLTWVRKYSSIPRKERIKSRGWYWWPVFSSLARAGSWGCSSRGTGPGHSLWCCHLHPPTHQHHHDITPRMVLATKMAFRKYILCMVNLAPPPHTLSSKNPN